MPSDWNAILAAAQRTLQAVETVGRVDIELNFVPPWVQLNRPSSLWEITITSSISRDAGAGPQAWEDVAIKFEGFMPMDPSRSTTSAWYTQVMAVRDALLVNPCLKDANGTATIRDTGRPRITRIDYVTFTDTQKQARCHHAVVELPGLAFYTYSPQ